MKQKKPLTIVDIANQLNISSTTVSFILNGKAKERRISDKLRDKVLKFVSEVGYKPNLLARSFRTGKTNIIGLMVENISNPFFANVARLIEENAYKNGYKILYCSTENNPVKAKELLQMFKDRYVDGYIITPPEGIKEEVDLLVKDGAPVILFDRFFENGTNDYVILDNFKSTYNAVEHLVAQGFKEIGFVTINSLQSQMQQRLYGYEQAIDDHGLNHYVKEVDFSLDTDKMSEYVAEFLKRRKKLDAVIFATNYLGIGGLKAIKKLGLKIPADLGVVSFDDHMLFELHTPSITSIAQPIEAMSEQLINVLIEKLVSDSQESYQITLPGNLVVRESSVKSQP